eukprot:3655998-Karenia_brevis.AAC.1
MTRVRATRPCGMKPGSCGMELNRMDENEAEGACDPASYQKCQVRARRPCGMKPVPCGMEP